MGRLICANVVSDAYFEAPADLSPALWERGDRLGWRMAWLTRPDDMLLVACQPSRAFLESVTRVLGHEPTWMSVDRQPSETLPEAALRAGVAGGGWECVVPYAHSSDVYRLADTLGCAVDGPTADAVRRGLVRSMNAKTEFHRVSDALGIPTPPAVVIDPAGEPCRSNLPDGHLLMLKERLSGGGLGNRVVERDVDEVTRYSESPYVVETYETFVEFPSVDFLVSASGDPRVMQACKMRITDDAYDGLEVVSAAATSSAQTLAHYGLLLGRYWTTKGFRGWYDIDGAVRPDGTVVANEVNARCTGGTTIDAVARIVLGGNYASEGYVLAREHQHTSLGSEAALQRLEASGLLAAADGHGGVAPLWESREENALGYVVAARSQGEAERLERQFLEMVHA